MKGKKISLRNILITSLVIIFFLTVIIVNYFVLYSQTREKIIKSGEMSSTDSADQIDRYLSKGADTIRLVSYILDNMIRSGKSQDEIHTFLVNQSLAVLNTTSDNSTGIYGYIRGEYLDGTDWVPDADYVPTERPWYIDARAHIGRVAIVDPYVDAQTNTIMITFSKTLCDAKSVVAMDFSLDKLQLIIQDIASEGNLVAEILLDQKYSVIAHSDINDLGKNYLSEKDSLGSAIVSKLRETKSGFFSLRYEGKKYIVYAVSVSDDWLSISVYKAASIYSQLILTVIATIIISLLVIVILILFLIALSKKAQFTRLQSVVAALAAAIDAKDEYTNGHSGRVAEYAKEISKRFGYSKKHQNEIYMMGLLHDVGKIGIPDMVINKPSRLTSEEYEIIKNHATIGAEILSQNEEMSRLALGARWHHERYDGLCYPDKLKGNEISEEARIIAVADAFDAMTSKRSYRRALDINVVKAEIEKEKGKQFDPVFADIMLKIIDEDKYHFINKQKDI